MNQESHWNNIASHYDDEVFDVFKSDQNQILQKYFKKHANPEHEVIDFGCGIGKSFEYLAPAFKKILAIDISEECLVQARNNPYTNITYKRMDLTGKNLRLPQTDFALCCNVAILPEVEMNKAIIRNISKTLKPGGVGIVVIPSIESILYASQRVIDWYKKEKVKPNDIPDTEFDYFKKSKRDIVQGIMTINGVPTKHYLATELHVWFEENGLTITALEKLEYSWKTEFASPPAWLQAPYPWDWMVECKKVNVK